MSANTILTSTVTAGSNNHTTSAEEANVLATDFVTQGVVGAITLNTGLGGTGSFAVNQNTGSDMAIIIKAGQAYISATPSSQGSQVLRARAAADYTAYSISSNASGSTKYDWVYLKVDPTKANNPASDASDVTSIVVSRSSSNTTDNGTPPTYGLNLGYITVANGATAITNSLITDKRFNASVGAQNGSLVVTQSATGLDAKIQAAGTDANVNLSLLPKGTGTVKSSGINYQTITTNSQKNNVVEQWGWGFITAPGSVNFVDITITLPLAYDTFLGLQITNLGYKAAADPTAITDFASGSGFDSSVLKTASATAPVIRVFNTIGSNWGSGERHGFMWHAVGIKN